MLEFKGKPEGDCWKNKSFHKTSSGISTMAKKQTAGFCSVNHHILSTSERKPSSCMFPTAFCLSEGGKKRRERTDLEKVLICSFNQLLALMDRKEVFTPDNSDS